MPYCTLKEMIRLRRWPFWVVLFISATVIGHEYYVSITTIVHDARTASLEITVKIFTDDLEAALAGRGYKHLAIGGKAERVDSANAAIADFLAADLLIRLDGDTLRCRFLGKEVEDDLTYCYLTADSIASFQEIIVRNRLLMAAFYTQVNMVRVHQGGQQKNLVLNRGTDEGRLTFQTLR